MATPTAPSPAPSPSPSPSPAPSPTPSAPPPVTIPPSPSPAPAPAPASQTFWDKYGKLIAGLGYGLAGLLLIAVIYFATSSCSSAAPTPTARPTSSRMSPPVRSNTEFDTMDSATLGGGLWGFKGFQKGVKKICKKGAKACKKASKKLRGGCGCTGISGAMP